MKQGSTLFLKIAVIFLGIPVLALCIFLLPKVAFEAIEEAQKGAMMAYVVLSMLIIMYVTVIPYFLALYQTLRLLSYIDKNYSFSERSIIALRKIRNCAITISSLYVVALPLFYMLAEWDDAPGLILLGLVIVGASMIIAVFATVLEKLLQEAIHFKSENDLTI